MKRIAVLMSVHNRRDKTLRCLECLYANPLPDGYALDIYLTDDGCSDGTIESICYQYPNIHVIKGDGTLYWNRGMLAAWKEAAKENYDFFMWLNDDTYLNSIAIENLLYYHSKHPSSIIVGSTASKEKEITYGGYSKEKKIINPIEKEEQCEYFNGNVVLIPKSVYEQLGMLDKRYIHSMGDFEYGMRARRNNIMSYAIPGVGICERNSNHFRWLDTNYSVWDRIKYLYSPLGQNPIEAFHLIKSESLLRAVAVFLYLNLKACFPKVLKNRNHQ